MAEYWFVAKSKGIGIRPANRKGWAALGVFVALNLVLAMVIVAWFGRSLWSAALTLLDIGIASFIFAVICQAKTAGPWHRKH